MIKPRVGTAVTALSGYNLGEEDAQNKFEELNSCISKLNFDVIPSDYIVDSIENSEKASKRFSQADVDLIVILIGTWTPDFFITPIPQDVERPVAIWALDRDILNISLCGSQNVMAALYEFGKQYKFIFGEFDDEITIKNLYSFSRACAVKNKLRKSKVGYFGAHPDFMTSLMVDEYAVRNILGPMLINFGNEDIIINRESIEEPQCKKEWENIIACAGCVKASKENADINSKTLLYLKRVVEEYNLDAISINCLPHLKGQVCIPIARLNDMGIPAACEGDLNSTVAMYILYLLSGKAVSNNDQFKVYLEDNSIVFSHCGAGPFSLASNKEEINIHSDFETGKGLGVYFPINTPGEVTICNLIGRRDSYRMFVTRGEVIHTDMIYEGNPLRVKFNFDVRGMLDKIAEKGHGHHWNITWGNYVEELKEFCRLINITCNLYL